MIALHEFARVLAECLLNSVAEGMAIALFAWMVLRASGRKSSSTRFAVWFSALIAMAALPWLHGFGAASVRPAKAVPAFTLPASWITGVFLGWALIAGLGVLRVFFGLWHLRRLRLSSTVIDRTTLDPRLGRTLEEFSFRKVTLAVSERVDVPAAIGFLKPRIVLPTWSMRELSAEELNSILIHELAHLRRWDDWTNLAQKVLRALFFFHPAIWWVENQLSVTREMACDDIVLSSQVSPRSYAECLVSVAEKRFIRRSLALAQAAVSRMRHTTQRVARILDRNRPLTTGVWKPALGLVAAFSAVCLVVVARAPEMIAFQSAVPNIAISSPVTVPAIDAKWNEAAAPPIPNRGRIPKKAAITAKPVLPRHGSGVVARDANELNAQLILPVSKGGGVPPEVTLETVLVVVQSGVDGPAQISWTLCVWRMTPGRAGGHMPVPATIPAKSI